MTNQERLKARLLKLKDSLVSYRCNGARAYGIAAGLLYKGWNPTDKDGARFVENLESAGLRFVGFADELTRAVKHTGWYCDSFEDLSYRGAVLQLPGKDGRPRFVAAYADPWNKDAYRVDMSRGFFEGASGDNSEDGKREAAIAADEFARVEAESAREYDEAWQAGSRFASLGDEVAASRKETLALFYEMKRAGRRINPQPLPAICATLRRRIESLVESIAEARKEREKLRDDIPHDLESAFNEGAGLQVFAGVAL